MLTVLQIKPYLHITLLPDIQHQDVIQFYHEGVLDGLSRTDTPIPLTYLITNLKRAINAQVFDGKQSEAARNFVGFHLGRIHGAVLTPYGTCRQNATTLVLLESKDSLRGYRAGRHWFFKEAEPQERRLTDTYVVERFEELAHEAPKWRNNPEATWQFAIACIFGELSGYLFPVTPQEQAIWEQERQEAIAWLARQKVRDTQLVSNS